MPVEPPRAVRRHTPAALQAASASAKPVAAAVSVSCVAAISCNAPQLSAAAENAVDGRDAERERSAACGREAGSRFGRAKLPTQPIEGGRHPG